MERRTTVLAAAANLMRALQRQSLADRLVVAEGLTATRQEIHDAAVATLHGPIRSVERHVSKLKDELVVCGYLSRRDADRLGHSG